MLIPAKQSNTAAVRTENKSVIEMVSVAVTGTEQSKTCSPLPAKTVTSVYGGAIKKQKSFQKHSKSAEMFEKSNI